MGPALDDGTPWDPDPHNWPHMRRGGAQDIGVVSAWHRLWEADRIATPVQVTVVDGGFSREPDTPFAQTIPPDAYGRPSRWPNSGGAPAPWHGTGVAGSIASFATDGQGSAGSAAPLARLRMSLLETPAPEFFAIANALLQHVPQALSWGPRSQT